MMFGSFCRERHFRATCLTSVRGRTLNGKDCIITGYDESTYRLHCRFEGVQNTILLKGKNLQPLKGLKAIAKWEKQFPTKFSAVDFNDDCKAETGENFLEALAEALESKLDLTRKDIKFRLKKMSSFIHRAVMGPKNDEELTCGDNGPSTWIPPTIMDHLKSACMGNGKVDFKEFANHLDPHRSVLMKRFQEYAMTGMCVKCQIYTYEIGE